jgi:hypothetical protein
MWIEMNSTTSKKSLKDIGYARREEELAKLLIIEDRLYKILRRRGI